ncbi:hypothetical protein DI487_10200 [Flavobacterium sediminis]|uniref:Uncharacterized protein n=1 Tax=Flavobacterium sediminis TaxID=2201181 RepID=A0A2U8QVN1_9FLAO|nr:hypothetical protein DI487_10200 [Flavobacterium sediminis]
MVLYLVFFYSLLFGVSGGFLVVFCLWIPHYFDTGQMGVGCGGGTGGRWGVRLFYIVQIMAS